MEGSLLCVKYSVSVSEISAQILGIERRDSLSLHLKIGCLGHRLLIVNRTKEWSDHGDSIILHSSMDKAKGGGIRKWSILEYVWWGGE